MTVFGLYSIAGLALLALSASPVGAVPITASFEGVWTEVGDTDGVLPEEIRVGAPFRIDYAIDNAEFFVYARPFPVDCVAICRFGVDPERVSAILAVGSTVVQHRDDALGVVWIEDLPGGDRWEESFFLAGFWSMRLTIAFADSTGQRLDGVEPFVNNSLTGWDSTYVEMFTGINENMPHAPAWAVGFLIPEPTPVGLLALGLILLSVFTRRRAF